MANRLELTFVSGDSAPTETVTVTDLIIGGWTGRDKAKLEEHNRRIGGDRRRAAGVDALLLSRRGESADDGVENTDRRRGVAAARRSIVC